MELFFCVALFFLPLRSRLPQLAQVDFFLLNHVWCDLEIPSNAVNWGRHRTHPTYLLFLPERSPPVQCLKTDVLFALPSL